MHVTFLANFILLDLITIIIIIIIISGDMKPHKLWGSVIMTVPQSRSYIMYHYSALMLRGVPYHPNVCFHFKSVRSRAPPFIKRRHTFLHPLTPRSWALLEKQPVAQLLKKIPTFYGTRRFITVFKRALRWSLSWARSIQFTPTHPISLRSILILSYHLWLGRPSGLLPCGVPTKTLYAFLFSPRVLHS
jgi:hypothetical protein